MNPPQTWFVPAAVEASWISRPMRSLPLSGGASASELLFPATDPAALEELLAHLETAGAQLARLPLDTVMDALSRTGAAFADPDSPARALAIEWLARTTGRSESMITETLNAFLDKLTLPGLRQTVAAAVADPRTLDRFTATAAGRRRRAVAPRLTFHVLAGNTPWAGAESLVAATLARSASLVKLSSEEPVFAGLLARALAAASPEIGSAIAVLHWSGGKGQSEEVALAGADAVVVFGDNTTVSALAQKLAPGIAAGRVRFLPRGHRASVAVLGAGVLASESDARGIAARLAEDFALEDQEGCLSPHAAYLETPAAAGPGAVSPERFAGLLADALESCERRWPRRELAAAEAARVQAARATAELRGAVVLASEASTRWTVLLDTRVEFEVAPLHRFAVIRPVATFEEAIRALAPACGMLSTVAIAGFGEWGDRVLGQLAGLRPGRICSVGEMQRPPAGWNHDGASDLAALLTWVECEGEERE